jgi:hypothetical protein
MKALIGWRQASGIRSASAPSRSTDGLFRTEKLQQQANETVASIKSASAESRDQLKQRIDQARVDANLALMDVKHPPRLVRVGIDAAIVAQHEVCVRATDAQGRVRTDRFRVQPTLAGLRSLSSRLAEMPGVVAVAEPTSMTWLGLSVALAEAGCGLSLLGARHAARLRGAISGKHKSDVIDADVLARAGEVFDLRPVRPVEPAQLALRRACVRRGTAVLDGNRYLRRLMSLARWAFPDVWNGFRGSLPTAVAVLDRFVVSVELPPIPLRLAGGPFGASLGIGHVGEVFGDVEGQRIQIQMPLPERRPGSGGGTDRLHQIRHIRNAAGVQRHHRGQRGTARGRQLSQLWHCCCRCRAWDRSPRR